MAAPSTRNIIPLLPQTAPVVAQIMLPLNRKGTGGSVYR